MNLNALGALLVTFSFFSAVFIGGKVLQKSEEKKRLHKKVAESLARTEHEQSESTPHGAAAAASSMYLVKQQQQKPRQWN